MRKKKFIVVENIQGNIRLRLGYPFYHRDLLYKNEDCLGGGEWDIDFDNKQIKLFGKSDDFGAVNPKVLQKAIDNIDVHTSWQIEYIVECIYNTEIDLNDFSIIKL